MTSSNPGNLRPERRLMPQHLALSPRQQPRRLTTAVQPVGADSLLLGAGLASGGHQRVRKTRSYVGEAHRPPQQAVAASTQNMKKKSAVGLGLASMNQGLCNTMIWQV